MKRGILERFLLFAGALFVCALGIALFIAGLQFSAIALAREGQGFFSPLRMAVLLAGLLAFLYGLFVLLSPRRARKDDRHFVIQKVAGGELRIAVKAIESLVQKCVDMHQEMETSSLLVRNRRDGLHIDLSISLAGNISIPLAVASLQKQIRQYLMASSGIDVRQLRVSVETAEQDIPESPYLVQAGEAAVPSVEGGDRPGRDPGRKGLFRRRPQAGEAFSEPPAGEAPAGAPPLEEEPGAPAGPAPIEGT